MHFSQVLDGVCGDDKVVESSVPQASEQSPAEAPAMPHDPAGSSASMPATSTAGTASLLNVLLGALIPGGRRRAETSR